MDVCHNPPPELMPASIPSPITSERIGALAKRAIESAPALTAGEMRELAEAILEHQARSELSALDAKPEPAIHAR